MAYASLLSMTSSLSWCKANKQRTTWSLPSIAHFDHRPPHSAMQWRESTTMSRTYDSYESSPLAGPSSPSPQSPSPITPDPTSMLPIAPTPTTNATSSSTSSTVTATASSKWFWIGSGPGPGPQPSPQAIAEKTCEMVCYLWFSNTLGVPKSSPHRRARAIRQSRPGHPPPDGLSDASTAALQFQPSVTFIHFVQKLLQTTQVSQSVIVLSLHYIYRLKEENHFTNGQAGSEFRVAVVALMLANKFVDDNTYTNKTWSDVSGIELEEINKMEREFLRGVDFRLYVSTDTYKAWVNLLKGLVSAKERDEQQWRYSRPYVHAPAPRLSIPTIVSPRARSVSPLPSLKAAYPFTFTAPTFNNPFTERAVAEPRPQVPLAPGTKRPAIVAFSPPSAALSLPERPCKRPISLDMSVVRPSYDAPVSAGSTVSAFAKLSLNKPDTPCRSSKPRPIEETAQTLAAPYNLQERMTTPDPETLYYYVLASSPATEEGDNRARKAFLRSHQPTYYTPTTAYAPPPHPMYIQSASASPVQALPPFRYLNPHLSHLHAHRQYFTNTVNHLPPPPPPPRSTTITTMALPPIRVLPDPTGRGMVLPLPPQSHSQNGFSGSNNRVPVAPFANAGPPGVQWTPAQSHMYAHPRYVFPQV